MSRLTLFLCWPLFLVGVFDFSSKQSQFVFENSRDIFTWIRNWFWRQNSNLPFLSSTIFPSTTLFENYQKCRICIFQFWPFPPFMLTCLVTPFDRKLQVFKKWTIFGIFDELLSSQNVNVARFALNIEREVLRQNVIFLWLARLSDTLGY